MIGTRVAGAERKQKHDGPEHEHTHQLDQRADLRAEDADRKGGRQYPGAQHRPSAPPRRHIASPTIAGAARAAAAEERRRRRESR